MNKDISQSHENGLELTTLEVRNLKEVQRAFLPRVCPHCFDMPIAARNIMKYDFGGDFYDFTNPHPKLWGFWIGDATGKGIVASSVSAVMYGLLHHMCKEQASPGEVMAEFNETLHQLNTRVQDLAYPFSATSFYGLLNTETGSLTYASAGHPAPVLIDPAANTCVPLGPTGPPLGFSKDWKSGEIMLPSVTGKKIVMYTDGLLYGKQNTGFTSTELIEYITSIADLSAQDIVDKIFKEADEKFRNEYHDDMTVIVVDFSHLRPGKPYTCPFSPPVTND